ncbi:phage tail tip fiber protein, partial [Klebsiella pneumoniae]|uniref:phage tail tip fiber protein n=1 Tax=Klebsiella pneumoniae TaxID=573 RepID=UPI0018774E2D
GQAYINLGLKLSDKVAEMYSGLGVSALANAAGVLSSNVSQIGNDVVSNSQSITQLRNALTQTDANMASKADQTAMNSLTGRVEKTESGLTAANSNITSLSSSLSQQSKRGANLLPDGTFESYAVGHNLSNNRVIVTTDDSHGGNKCIRVTRPNDYNANATDNSDNHIFSGFQVRDNAVFYMECWVKRDAKSTAMAENAQISIGLSLQYQDNSWQWPAVTKAAKDLSSTQWTKVSGYLKSTKSGIKQAMVRISIPNVSSVKAGNSFLIDDLVITEVTDAYNAQSTADANANAISTLNSTVSQQGDQITSQGNSITKLTNDLATTNNNVSNKADANALTALTNRVTQTEKDINSTSSSVTNLNNKVDSISVGGTNLIKNSGDMTGWSNVTSETYRGNAVIGATVKAGSGYKNLREITLESPVDAGEYVYSFYAKGGVAGQTMTAFFYNPNTTTSIETSQGAKGNNTDGRAYFTLTTSWVRYWVKWKQTPTTGTKRLILCRIESNTSKDQTVYINSPKFEVGNVVSDWNDSPADSASASAVDLLTTTVNQQGTSISSIGNRTTSLENGLSTAQNNIARKADASALQDLRNTVTSQGGDLTAANSSITSLQASMNRRTVFTITARGNGNSVTPGVFDESGKNLFTPGRSWALVTFAKHSDGSTVIATSKTYDVFGSANNGATMSADIEALASGTYVCVLTFDEPSGNRGKILSALESLGGTSEVVNSLPYRGAYILLGRKGMRSGDGLELRAPTGGDATAHISTSVEFVNGIMMGLGAAGGVMMKADANASAITTLQNTVKTQGGNIDSLSSSITALENSLRSTNDTVSKKADTTAVSSLTGRVSQVENTITSQSQSITSLTSSINTISTQGANPWVDGTFESYGDGHVLGGGGTAVVVASQKFTGNKSLQVSRGANNNGNSDKQLGSWQSVREDAKFRFEFWAMMPADQAPSSGWTTLVGINSLNAAGQNSWQSAVTVSEAALGARDKWVKFTGIASNNGGGRTRAVVWISTRGASGSGTPGYSLYIDDLVITDVTDAKAAQDASDATASAVSGLTARVTDAEGKITAQAQQQTALATKVDNANSRVDNMAKTLSDSQSTQASLNTSLQSQIDAQAAANIKNQTTLDNTIKSVASITSTQQTHATALEALATQQTTLTSSVGDLSASVQNTAKTVADVNGTVSSLWSMKVETVNGKNVGAGITLGSNGETSDMILYADRFSLFNRNNATAVPVMVAEGNELYIDTARIKNSSLTSAKIADGSITNAKIGNEIRSNNFVDGSQGWRIAKDGSSQFNNVIVRGRVEANSGVFRGTVQADSFIGDIAVAKSYDSLTFRRNQTVQRNGAYQNRGYSMTVVLACTLVCQTYGTGSGLGYTSDITFNIGGQEVTRRIFVDAGNITGGTTAFELRFAARLDADYNNVGFFIRASGRTAAIDYTCTVENITATAFRTDSSSFS